jgi:prophage regulatory protein
MSRVVESKIIASWQGLRIWQVQQATGLARSTIYEMVKRGEFPRMHAISKRVSIWHAAEVQAWLEAKMKGVAHEAA